MTIYLFFIHLLFYSLSVYYMYIEREINIT